MSVQRRGIFDVSLYSDYVAFGDEALFISSSLFVEDGGLGECIFLFYVMNFQCYFSRFNSVYKVE